ncbi:MAG TPA: hypothetical protein VGF13_22940 [Verrucomicrobiae bacterium]|jgi:hypothetical protein
MPGVLNFSLGLATAGFTGPSGLALASFQKMGDAAKAFGAALAAVGALTVAGTLREINDAGNKFDIGARLRESVSGISKLQFALKQIGESGDVGPLMTTINKSLGGVSESGEETASAFKKMGLSVSQLKSLDAPERCKRLAARSRNCPLKKLTISRQRLPGVVVPVL